MYTTASYLVSFSFRNFVEPQAAGLGIRVPEGFVTENGNKARLTPIRILLQHLITSLVTTTQL